MALSVEHEINKIVGLFAFVSLHLYAKSQCFGNEHLDLNIFGKILNNMISQGLSAYHAGDTFGEG